MKMTSILALTSLLLLAPACGGNGGDEDTAQDPSTDLVQDEGHETVSDPPPEGEIPSEPDLPPDVIEDPASDDATTDPTEDADGVDAPVDAPGCGDGCMEGLECCNERCVNLLLDPENCNECGRACPEARPYCDNGRCAERPCDSGTVCTGITFCCRSSCCELDQICCEVQGPGPWLGPMCYDDYCPGGCPLCD